MFRVLSLGFRAHGFGVRVQQQQPQMPTEGFVNLFLVLLVFGDSLVTGIFRSSSLEGCRVVDALRFPYLPGRRGTESGLRFPGLLDHVNPRILKPKP